MQPADPRAEKVVPQPISAALPDPPPGLLAEPMCPRPDCGHPLRWHHCGHCVGDIGCCGCTQPAESPTVPQGHQGTHPDGIGAHAGAQGADGASGSHGRDIDGWISMRCGNAMDGCDDKACVCICHLVAPTEPAEPLAPATAEAKDVGADDVYERAARAWCVTRFDYVGPYVSADARDQHIAIDAHGTAVEPAFRAAVDAARADERARIADELLTAEDGPLDDEAEIPAGEIRRILLEGTASCG